MNRKLGLAGVAGPMASRLLLGLAAAASLAGPGLAQPAAQARIDTGQLQGVSADGVIAFKGIPFAQPPVGDLRWRPPQPIAPWTGVRVADTFGADCMQGRFGPPPPAATTPTPATPGPGSTAPTPPATPAAAPPPAPRAPSEDCLYLNVWKPAQPTSAKLPVLVWIYGGGFTGGSSASPQTAGTAFAQNGVITVAMNYRLGRFGFFGHPALSAERPDDLKGNYGYMDQITALQWVKRNIAAFGGDPNNVTISGFSAGGVSVHSLMASPLARGLFQKAIVHSGGSRDGIITPRPMKGDRTDPNYPVSGETIGVNFARSMGIEGTDAAAMASLRALTAQQVLAGATGSNGPDAPMTAANAGFVDGKLVTLTAEKSYKARQQARVPVLLGSNSADTAGRRINATDKAGLWARFRQWSDEARMAYDPTGDRAFAALLGDAEDDYGQAEGARFAADAFARDGQPTYIYRFSYVPAATLAATASQPRQGSPHGGDVPYAFGTLAPRPGGAAITPQDWAVSKMTQAYWVNFLKTGNPNGAGLPTWARHAVGDNVIHDFKLDGSSSDGPDPRKARLDVTQKAFEAGIRSDFEPQR